MSWWQDGVIYQIYPRSFTDSDGDGVGDLRGIRARLDYLTWLGVDAIWISPIYPSPMADFGYDVSDFCDVDPLFGTLANFDALVRDAHERGLKVILDYVPNHTSDRHPWFVEPALARQSEARLLPVARRQPGGGPPNNWLSEFGGPAWTWDAEHAAVLLPLLPGASSPISTGATRRCAPRCSTCCASGSTAASTASASTRSTTCIKDDQYRDNPPNPDYQPGERRIDSLLPVYTPIGRRCTTSCADDARGRSTAIPIACSSARLYLPFPRLDAVLRRTWAACTCRSIST